MGYVLRARLAAECGVLELIDRRRAETGDNRVGSAVERRILDRELRELEYPSSEALENGARQALARARDPRLRFGESPVWLQRCRF